jgi:ataxia telangiectasia mutated family protein
MGITGYHGVFQKACEYTLSLLRTEKAILITLLEVLKYDPLHSWTVSPLKLNNVQGDESIDNNVDVDAPILPPEQEVEEEADFALFGIQKKLLSSLTVECQIQDLINTAVDKRNLCRMYPGWQPWI